MIGFAIGLSCLIGLVFVLRRGRRAYWGHHGHHHHHGCGYRGHHHHHGRHGWGPRGDGRMGMLWHLFERLDTTPGQEKVIREAVEELRETARGMRREMRASGDDVSRAMRGESFDETVMGDMFARHDDRIRELQKAFVGAMAKIHDALDERQRARLADFLESGPRMGFGGPYRGWV